MYPKRNYKELYSFPRVWDVIFLLLNGGRSGDHKGVGDSYLEELQEIYKGITERKYYPKSFPKVWRALRYLCKLYGIEVPSSDNGNSSDSVRTGENESGSGDNKLEINIPGKTKVLEP